MVVGTRARAGELLPTLLWGMRLPGGGRKGIDGVEKEKGWNYR